MTWSDVPLHPTRKALRQFAAAWLVFFLAFGLHQYFVRGHHTAGTGLMVMAVVLGPVGLIWPMALRWLFVGWMVLAFPIGWLVSLIMVAVMFYGVITPVAFIFRLRGRDLLKRKPAPDQASFWLPKQEPADIRSYFRQF